MHGTKESPRRLPWANLVEKLVPQKQLRFNAGRGRNLEVWREHANIRGRNCRHGRIWAAGQRTAGNGNDKESSTILPCLHIVGNSIRTKRTGNCMSHKKVTMLSSADALRLGRDAKIVAIRWDLVPWCIVLDCDVPVHEGSAPIRRAWMVFNGIDELSWSIESARLPNGIFSTNSLVASESTEGFCKYELAVLAPTFSGDKLSNNPHRKMQIIAKSLIGAASIAMSRFGEFGPDRQQRNSLATEEEFLQAIGNVREHLGSRHS